MCILSCVTFCCLQSSSAYVLYYTSVEMLPPNFRQHFWAAITITKIAIKQRNNTTGVVHYPTLSGGNQIHRVWENHGWFYEAGGILGIFGVRPEENCPVTHMKWRIFLDHSINLFNQTHHESVDSLQWMIQDKYHTESGLSVLIESASDGCVLDSDIWI